MRAGADADAVTRVHGRLHHRPEQCEEGRVHGHPEPVAPKAAPEGDGHGDQPEEHPHGQAVAFVSTSRCLSPIDHLRSETAKENRICRITLVGWGQGGSPQDCK